MKEKKRFLSGPVGSRVHPGRKLILLAFLGVMLTSTIHGENLGMASYSFSGGMHLGGITKTEGLDAVSSASRWQAHGGVHAEVEIAGQIFETGLDYSYLKKELTYKDTSKSISGETAFAAHALSLPLLYNLRFFNRPSGGARLVLGLGLTAYYFPHQELEATGTVPDSDSKNWALGPAVRLGWYPIELMGRYCIGPYAALFRSFNRFYDIDFEGAESGELAIMELGINLKVRTR